MKYVGLVCGALFLFSCDSNEGASETVATALFDSDHFSYGELYETISFNSLADGASLEVMIREIYDSRCFSDVVCIQGGWAAVNFEIHGVPSFSLKTGESREFIFNGKSFRLALTDVAPYPNTTNQAQLKEAVFSVIRL